MMNKGGTMKPTDKPVASDLSNTWPERIYLSHIDYVLDGKPFTRIEKTVYRATKYENCLGDTHRADNIEYVRADIAQPQFTPEQLQSVLDTIMKCQDMARYERDYSLQDELTAAIALLKGMK